MNIKDENTNTKLLEMKSRIRTESIIKKMDAIVRSGKFAIYGSRHNGYSLNSFKKDGREGIRIQVDLYFNCTVEIIGFIADIRGGYNINKYYYDGDGKLGIIDIYNETIYIEINNNRPIMKVGYQHI